MLYTYIYIHTYIHTHTSSTYIRVYGKLNVFYDLKISSKLQFNLIGEIVYAKIVIQWVHPEAQSLTSVSLIV